VTDLVAFSTEIEAIYGKGVNVFSGSGWGTPQSLISLHYQIKYKKAVPHLFHVNAVQAKAIDQSVRGLRVSFVRDVLHHLAHQRPLDRIALRAQWLHDPQSYFFFFPITIRILATAIADRLKR
jgi:succinoglycan biosynthesis protein ExoW